MGDVDVWSDPDLRQVITWHQGWRDRASVTAWCGDPLPAAAKGEGRRWLLRYWQADATPAAQSRWVMSVSALDMT
jgi:hypothetical protein